MERTCYKCRETIPIEKFVIDKKQKWGHTYICKPCANERQKILLKNNPLLREKKSNRHKEWLQENKEKVIATSKAYQRKNKDKFREYAKKNYIRHMDSIRYYQKQYHESNKEFIRQINKKYRITNREKINFKSIERSKDEIANLKDSYIIDLIQNTVGLSRKEIRYHPYLIESYRVQIKVNRLLKQKKNENIKTS